MAYFPVILTSHRLTPELQDMSRRQRLFFVFDTTPKTSLLHPWSLSGRNADSGDYCRCRDLGTL